MSAIQPFIEQGHYTSVHDEIFDVVMPKCPPNAWKILCLVVRKTRGWRKEQDTIAYSQIREGTGIRSDETISKSLKWLIKENLLEVDRGKDRDGHQRVSKYSLNREYRIEQTPEIEVEPTPGNVVRVATETVVRPSTEIEDYNNHRVTTEPKDKNHTPVGAETSSAAEEISNLHGPRQGQGESKSPEDHVGKLIDDLEEMDVHLDRDQVRKIAGNFGKLKTKGISHTELVRARQRMVSEWPRIQLSPQQAHADLAGDSKSGKNGDPDEEPMYAYVERRMEEERRREESGEVEKDYPPPETRTFEEWLEDKESRGILDG